MLSLNLNERGRKMPYLIVTSVYPGEKAPEVGEKYFEALNKYPTDENLVTQLVPAAGCRGGNRRNIGGTHREIQVMGISEVKKGKLNEAFSRLVSMMIMFDSIQGFEYRVEIYLKVEEAQGNWQWTPLVGQPEHEN
jgi:hypothetical protein